MGEMGTVLSFGLLAQAKRQIIKVRGRIPALEMVKRVKVNHMQWSTYIVCCLTCFNKACLVLMYKCGHL